MKEQIWKLLKEVVINVLFAIAIFAVVVGVLYFLGLVVYKAGSLINKYLPLEIAAGIIGSAYVLTIKNPNNYLGLILGIVTSILLAIQFFFEGFKDQTILYCIVFIPCQILTLVKWISASKGTSKDSQYAVPSFMKLRGLLLGLLIFIVIMGLDLFFLQKDIVLATIMSACVVAASTEANFLMIRKYTDAWFYWVAFSIFGLVQMICIQNYVTLTLYVLYTLINGSACIAWCKQTPKEKYGWVRLISGK